MVGAGVVFDDEVVAIGIDGIGFVIEFAHAVAKDGELRQLCHELFGEMQAQGMQGVAHGLGGADGGKQFAFLRRRSGDKRVIGAALVRAAIIP